METERIINIMRSPLVYITSKIYNQIERRIKK